MRHKGLKNLVLATLVAAGGWLVSTPAWSAPPGGTTFELDGNVTDDGGTAGDDWSLVNPPSNGGAGNILARSFKADPAPLTVFAGGGSKDDLDLNGPLSGAGGWKHKNGSVPDKDDITNAYAVAYNVGGELVIYAGADRFDNSGDAFIGFWFFKNQISLGAGGGGGGSPFVGLHAVGDVLVLANFTGGGTTVNIEILEWVGSGGDVNGTLRRIAGAAGGSPATCGSGSPTEPLYCGRANTTAGEQPPWAYLSKDNTSTFPAATFFEVGINITQVFQQAGVSDVPCFSSFMAETRASSSVSATLKDFVLDNFPVCGVRVTKQCANPTLVNGSTIQYEVSGEIANTGFGTLTNITLSDAPRPLGTVTYKNCADGSTVSFNGTLAPLATVCYSSTILTPENGEDDTITVTASTGGATVSDTDTADCPNIQLSPAIDVTKACAVVLSQVSGHLAVRVNATGSVCNIGDTPLSNVSVVDDMIGTLTLIPAGTTLAVGACRDFAGNYLPATAANKSAPGQTTLEPGLAKFTDTVTATATAAFGAQVSPDTATAECLLCPEGECPTGVTSGTSSSSLLKKGGRTR